MTDNELEAAVVQLEARRTWRRRHCQNRIKTWSLAAGITLMLLFMHLPGSAIVRDVLWGVPFYLPA